MTTSNTVVGFSYIIKSTSTPSLNVYELERMDMGVHLLLLSGNLSKVELCNLSQFVLVAICHNPSSGIELQTFNMYVLIQLLKPRPSGQMRNKNMHIYRTSHAL